MYEAIQLSNEVDYRAGSVVSKALIQKKEGSLTLFAFDVGQGLNEHTAPYDAYVTVLDGRAIITVGGEAVEVQAGMTIRLPAHVPHALSAPEPFKMMLVMIRG